MADLVLPYYYNHGVYKHFLFLSYGGLPLGECGNQAKEPDVIDTVRTAYIKIHGLRVFHFDAEPRNILYDVQSKTIMIIDFERATIEDSQILGAISPNSSTDEGKGCRPKEPKGEGRDIFEEELRFVLRRVSDWVDSRNGHW